MVCIGQLFFRELRARNDGAVLLDSHTLRVVTQLLQQRQNRALCGNGTVLYRLLSCKYPLFCKKNASGFTIR